MDAHSENGGAAVTAAPFHRVLVGWDGSGDAAEALRIAASVVGGDGGRITALAVLPQPVRLEVADEQETEHAALRHRVEDDFRRAWQRAPVVGARASLEFVENDKAGGTVCAYAEEHGFDLLVLGRHGTGSILRPRLGHVAQTAARDSAIPVLLVNRPEAAALSSLARRDRFSSRHGPLRLASDWWARRRRRPARR